MSVLPQDTSLFPHFLNAPTRNNVPESSISFMKSATSTPSLSQAIVATDLTKTFGEGTAQTVAVNKVGLSANFGEMLFIVGPSGSGKTTMLSMISGILRPDSGKVSVKGEDLWSQNNDQLAEFRLNTIGFVFQDYHLF